MEKKITRIILSAALLTGVFYYGAEVLYSQDLHRVNHGQLPEITAYEQCRIVNNNSSRDIMVPVKSEFEWAEFFTHVEFNVPGVSLQSCVPGGCVPGTSQPCGKCGMQTCLADGTWGSCLGEGVCFPETTEDCGNCGIRTCQSDCTWGSCLGQGVCSPGATEACGNCGTRTCQNNCTWGSCLGQGVCSPGATQACGTGGTQTCQNDCTWGTCIGAFPCGDPVTFTYKGSSVTYGTVESQGKCWMDRNLGASRVATAYNDSAAYGDLFQWGRLDDGHQTRTSGTTTTLSSTDNPGHSNFIDLGASPDHPYDWRSPQNHNLWQGDGGINDPCPSGWRVPTRTEWEIEQASWSPQNRNGAYASPLKLTAGGIRMHAIGLVGEQGLYWCSTVYYDQDAWVLNFGSDFTQIQGNFRFYGQSVRCIKD